MLMCRGYLKAALVKCCRTLACVILRRHIAAGIVGLLARVQLGLMLCPAEAGYAAAASPNGLPFENRKGYVVRFRTRVTNLTILEINLVQQRVSLVLVEVTRGKRHNLPQIPQAKCVQN